MPVWINRKNKRQVSVSFTGDTLTIATDDGKEAVFFLALYPELLEASDEDRADWQLSADELSVVWEKAGVSIRIDDIFG